MAEPRQDTPVLADATRRTLAGFTLIEVLVALFVFGLVFGLLQETVSESLKKMADTRDELTADERGQQTLREFGERLGRGENITNEEGDYEEPDGSRQFRYSVVVTPYQMALPRGVKADGPPLSAVFAGGNGNAGAEAAAPPVRRIVVRVFRKELGPESAQPLVSFVRRKPPQDEGAEDEGADPSQDAQAQDPNAQGIQDGISDQQQPEQQQRGGRRGRRGISSDNDVGVDR